MFFKWLTLAILAFILARWLFRDSLRAFLGRLDQKLNRVVNATLIALALVYAVRLVLLWLGIAD
jgi:uncharacterized membrane protein YdjX (TVP38/TMEM64 family)